MAKWLKQASQYYEMYCHDLEFMSLNPTQVELGCIVLLPKVVLEPKLYIYIEREIYIYIYIERDIYIEITGLHQQSLHIFSIIPSSLL